MIRRPSVPEPRYIEFCGLRVPALIDPSLGPNEIRVGDQVFLLDPDAETACPVPPRPAEKPWRPGLRGGVAP